MRFLTDIPNALFKISLYAWNNKYIVKIETDRFEQTYKISEFDLTDPDTEVPALLDEVFLATVAARFEAMAADWAASAERNEVG